MVKTQEELLAEIKRRDAETVIPTMNKYSFGAWSVSKLKCLRKCPLQFYLKYILKIKVPDELSGKEDSISAPIGSAAHRILEFVVIGKTIDEAFKKTKLEFVPSKLTDEQWRENVDNLWMSVQGFQDRVDKLNRNYKIKRAFTELRMGVTKDWEATDFFADNVYFRGIIDLVFQLENLDIIIIDHKTGGGQGSIRPYQDQLDTYKILFHKGLAPVAGAQAGIHFIREQIVKMGDYTEVKDIEKKLIDTLEWTIDGAIESVKAIGYWKHIRGPQCKWCEFNEMCKSGMLKDIERGSARFFKSAEVEKLTAEKEEDPNCPHVVPRA